MGIVNVTPDSFSDGGLHASTEAAIAHCERLCAEGADLLDIGGESTRPGARAPSADEERERVMPVLRHALRLGVPVSVDTRHAGADARGAGGRCRHRQRRAGAARRGRRSGAGGLSARRHLPDAHARRAGDDAAGAGLCRRGGRGRASSWRSGPRGCRRWAWRRSASCSTPASASARRWRTTSNCIAASRRCWSWAFRCLLAGRASRRWAQSPASRCSERLAASVAAALAAAQRGARVLRVHDVAATVDALRVWQAAGNRSEPDSFMSRRYFGTDGIRGTVGHDADHARLHAAPGPCGGQRAAPHGGAADGASSARTRASPAT